jgi:hypothetical protein
MSARKGEGFYKGTDVRRCYYTCAKERRGCGRVNADTRSVDRELLALVVTRLSDSRYAAALESARAQVNERLTAIQAEIAECEGVQAALSERLGRREINLTAFDRANEPLVKTLADLYAERDTLPVGTSEGPTSAQLPEVIEAQWDAAEVSEKRSMLTRALGDSTLFLDKYVKRSGPRVFDKRRLRLVPRDHA